MIHNKHSWINYPSRQKRKCTRCGVVCKENVILSDGKRGKLYIKNFIEFERVAPECINQ
jgi:hypothetical protein